MAAKNSGITELIPFYSDCQRIDWSVWSDTSDDPTCCPLMIAELKCLGGDYAPKMFAGLDIPLSFFSEESKLKFDIDHELIRDNRVVHNSLVRDYVKLLRYKHVSDPLRMLVLLLDKRCKHKPLSKCLLNVEFEQPGNVVIDTPLWLCKMWEIKKRL